MSFLSKTTLTGALVQLEPLSLEHTQDLQEACADGELWNLWYTFIPRPEGIEDMIRSYLKQQDAGQMLPFATRRLSDHKVIGVTTFYNVDEGAPRVFIGYTWNAASAQRSGTNAESKLLLLTHAFETLGCASVYLETHKFNHQSRKAIEAIGGSLDGILRNWRRQPDGSLRDTAMYSIVRDEWSAVKNLLNHRLRKYL